MSYICIYIHMYIPECCMCVYVRVSIAALQYNCEFYAYLPTNPPKNGWKHFFFSGHPSHILRNTRRAKGEWESQRKKLLEKARKEAFQFAQTLFHTYTEKSQLLLNAFFLDKDEMLAINGWQDAFAVTLHLARTDEDIFNANSCLINKKMRRLHFLGWNAF